MVSIKLQHYWYYIYRNIDEF